MGGPLAAVATMEVWALHRAASDRCEVASRRLQEVLVLQGSLERRTAKDRSRGAQTNSRQVELESNMGQAENPSRTGQAQD